jgi:hypothetical protein
MQVRSANRWAATAFAAPNASNAATLFAWCEPGQPEWMLTLNGSDKKKFSMRCANAGDSGVPTGPHGQAKAEWRLGGPVKRIIVQEAGLETQGHSRNAANDEGYRLLAILAKVFASPRVWISLWRGGIIHTPGWAIAITEYLLVRPEARIGFEERRPHLGIDTKQRNAWWRARATPNRRADVSGPRQRRCPMFFGGECSL